MMSREIKSSSACPPGEVYWDLMFFLELAVELKGSS